MGRYEDHIEVIHPHPLLQQIMLFMNNLSRTLICTLLFVSLQFSMTACIDKQRPHNQEDASLSLETVAFDGLERTYYVHLPPNYSTASTLPVVRSGPQI